MQSLVVEDTLDVEFVGGGHTGCRVWWWRTYWMQSLVKEGTLDVEFGGGGHIGCRVWWKNGGKMWPQRRAEYIPIKDNI